MEKVPPSESNNHYNYELTYNLKVNYVQVNNSRKITVFCKNLKRVTPIDNQKNHEIAKQQIALDKQLEKEFEEQERKRKEEKEMRDKEEKDMKEKELKEQ